MLSNLAVSWYVSAKLADERFPTRNAKKQQRDKTENDKKTHPEIKQLATHQTPRNMKEVNTKSSARMASAEYTTVLLIELDTPSAVGTHRSLQKQQSGKRPPRRRNS
jgi:hypothetical protein